MAFERRTTVYECADSSIKTGSTSHKGYFLADCYYQDSWWWIFTFEGGPFHGRSLHGKSRFDGFEAALADANANGVATVADTAP